MTRLLTRSALLLALCSLAAGVCASPAVDGAVKGYLHALAQKTYPGARIEVDLDLDPRLRLAACDDLSTTLRGQRRYGRVHVAVRCGSPRAWSVYLPAEIRVTTRVLVAARPLVRGQQLLAADVKEADRSLAEVGGGTLVARSSISGLSPKRPIDEGAVLTLPLFSQRPAVRANDVVRLASGRGPVQIETKGKALDDGHVGEQISVENLTSGRRISAWVVAAGSVSAQPAGGG